MTAEPASLPSPSEGFDAQVDSVVRVAQTLVAMTAQAMAGVEDVVSLPQFRVLVMASSEDSLNLRAVAAGLGVHRSNASRVCDRLVAGGLLDRRENADDRRQIVLTLTEDGRRLLDSVMRRRRAAIGEVLARLPADRRAGLMTGLDAFSAAAERLHGVG